MLDTYKPEVTLDLPADDSPGREITREVFGRSQTGKRTNHGVSTDDLDVTRDLECLVRKAFAAYFLNVPEEEIEVAPWNCVTLGTIRRVEADINRVEVMLQFDGEVEIDE